MFFFPKTSLDLTSCDKFCAILRTTLITLSQLLEIATLYDVGTVTEEILGYLKVTMALEPTWTVVCVQQVLIHLFMLFFFSLTKGFCVHAWCRGVKS